MRVREPFNAVSHLVGLLLAAAGTAALLRMAQTGPQLLAFSIYGATLLLLYGVSTLYHTLPLSGRSLRAFKRLDHIAIYLLIAGTYTPIGLIIMSRAWAIPVLSVVYAGAAAAILLKLFWVQAPKVLSAVLGLALGWVGVVAYSQIGKIGAAGIALILLGGLFYTVGAIVYARRRPDPLPAVLGYHELFHICTLGAAACHWAAIAFFVLPHA
jgi:hemolysin III